jgi:hypothetical protein
LDLWIGLHLAIEGVLVNASYYAILTVDSGDNFATCIEAVTMDGQIHASSVITSI